MLCKTYSRLGEKLQRNNFELPLSCGCRLESLSNPVSAIAEAVAMLGAPAAQYQGGREAIVLLREEARRKAAPVSLGKLDTMRWLGMQSNAALGDKIATTFPPVESASVPKYLWDDSGNCGRCESCMSLQRSVMVRTGAKSWERIQAQDHWLSILSHVSAGPLTISGTSSRRAVGK